MDEENTSNIGDRPTPQSGNLYVNAYNYGAPSNFTNLTFNFSVTKSSGQHIPNENSTRNSSLDPSDENFINQENLSNSTQSPSVSVESSLPKQTKKKKENF